MKQHVAVIKGGVIRSLYTDVVDMRKVGKVRVERASNVEYDNAKQGWVATLRPDYSKPCTCVSAPPCAREKVTLGPFTTHQEAIDAEVRYIQEHVL